MKETRITMGMPVTVEIVDPNVTSADIAKVFDYFAYIDKTFSPFKPESEVSLFNAGKHTEEAWSEDFRTVLRLCEETKALSEGYFDPFWEDRYDPSGIVKGWAIQNAAQLLHDAGRNNFYVDAGGDIQVSGKNADGELWRVGIRSPFDPTEIVKSIALTDEGIATSGTYVRGDHIYNPKNGKRVVEELVSLTVIGPNVFDADRFATAAFAMGIRGLEFLERLPGFEAYGIDEAGRATFTSGFPRFVQP